jgi:hypothetical protein
MDQSLCPTRFCRNALCTVRPDRARMVAGTEAVDCAHPWDAKIHRLDESLGGAAIALTPDDLHEIAAAAAKIEVQGARGSGHDQYL